MNAIGAWLTGGALLVAIISAIIAWFKAAAANRSAKAAERSAEAAERNYLLSERKLGLDLAVLKERWVETLGVALKNDGLKGTLAILPGLSAELRPEWLEILDLAAKAGWIEPSIWTRKREKWIPEWEKALKGDI